MSRLLPGDATRVVEISPRELATRFARGAPFVLLDVREDDERRNCAIPAGAPVNDLHIPLGRVPEFLDDLRTLSEGADLVVYCHHGVRSRRVADWLAAQGFDRLHNLTGGIDAWSTEVDPGTRRY